ncbi:MAG: energy-coupling factor transporter transmembrane component T family protein [Nostocoides sp.]
MSTVALYLPRASVIHRLPAGVKVAGLVLASIGILSLRTPMSMGGALFIVVGLYAAARLPVRVVARQLRAMALVAVAVGAVQLWSSGWERAVVLAGGFVALVLLAALVTLTTRTSDLVEVVERAAGPLRRFGVEPESIGLVVALGIRSVAVVAGLSVDVRDAARARGASLNPLAVVVPLVIRTLRYADRLGDALVARSQQ